MIPVRRIPLLVLALAITAAACSTDQIQLATVNGVDITESDLEVLYESNTLPVDEPLRTAIFRLVAREAIVQALDADFGVEVDQAEVDELFDQLMAEIDSNQVTPAEALAIPDASQLMVRFNAELTVIRTTAIEQLIDASGLVEELLAEPGSYTTVCASHVLVETEEAATTVLERLAAGEEIAAVADEVSIDTASPGGDLGCSSPLRYVPEFAEATMEAPVGEPFGPVQSTFGFHVILVDERIVADVAEVEENPAAFVDQQVLGGLWSDWFNEAIDRSEITVNERFGVWSEFGILPPEE